MTNSIREEKVRFESDGVYLEAFNERRECAMQAEIISEEPGSLWSDRMANMLNTHGELVALVKEMADQLSAVQALSVGKGEGPKLKAVANVWLSRANMVLKKVAE